MTDQTATSVSPEKGGTVKVCRNCRFVSVSFSRRIFGEYEFAKCLHPTSARDSAKQDVVTGKITPPTISYCDIVRGSFCNEDQCGAEAKHWQSRK